MNHAARMQQQVRLPPLPAAACCRRLPAAGTQAQPASHRHSVAAPAAAGPQYELLRAVPARAPVGFASLSSSLLGQQWQQLQPQPGRLLSQVPLFDLAR